MALYLVVAAIILWNTAYLDHALQSVTRRRGVCSRRLSAGTSRRWAGSIITITGTYHWAGVDSGLWAVPTPSAGPPSSLLKAKST